MPSDGWSALLSYTLQELEIEAPDGFAAEMDGVLRSVTSPGPFYALVHGDPCPDNWRLTNQGLKLFDFEFAAFTYDGFCLATIDAVYPRMTFPTCWCAGTAPRPVVEAFEATYRDTLAAFCPDARDDALFGQAMLTACAAWLLLTIEWPMQRALKDDAPWGIATIRSRVLSRCDAFLRSCDDFGRMPAFEAVVSDLRRRLDELWPETEPLALYPAFRGGEA